MSSTTTHGDPPLSCEFPPLHIAVIEGNVEKMSQLLSQGANVNQLTSYGDTPLHVAASEGTSLDVVKMLVKAGADVDRHNRNMFTPLTYACFNGHDSIGSYLLESGAEVNACGRFGKTPLLYATSAIPLCVPLISTLLKAKACVNLRGPGGATPLHAILDRRGIVHDGAEWDVLELLLLYPCDIIINAKEKYHGNTPLLQAVLSNDRKSALMLIKAGCKVDIEDRSGRVPIFHAIKKKLYPLVELLLAAGERIPREDWMEMKSLLERKDPSMLERLLAVGAECPRLPNVCRRAFYNHHGTQTRNRIDELPLSLLIKRYLTYEIL